MINDIYYKSADGLTTIHAKAFVPLTNITAIIQVSHGLGEVAELYTRFGNMMSANGIMVVVQETLGNGNSVIDSNHYGYFSDVNPEHILVEDMHSLVELIKKDYPQVPYFILGFSMGSFILRNYLFKYSNEINGAIIAGTTSYNNFLSHLFKLLINISTLAHGKAYASRTINNIMVGRRHKKFSSTKKLAWLTKTPEYIEMFNKDPRLNIRYTNNADKAIVNLIIKQNSKKEIAKIDKNLPIFIISGADDPISKNGKKLYRVQNQYRKAGITDIKLKTYNKLRHAVICESDNNVVLNDILQFVLSHQIKNK